MRIAKICPSHIWRPEILVDMLSFPEPCFALIDCFKAVLSILGPDYVGGSLPGMGSSELSNKSIETSRIGEKRPFEDLDIVKKKRPKMDGEIVSSEADIMVECKKPHVKICETEETYANNLHNLLVSFVGCLKASSIRADALRPEVSLTALSMLCIAFCRYPETRLSMVIFQEMISWIPWIYEQVA